MVSALLVDEPCVGIAVALASVYDARLAECFPAQTNRPEAREAEDQVRLGSMPPPGLYRQINAGELLRGEMWQGQHDGDGGDARTVRAGRLTLDPTASVFYPTAAGGGMVVLGATTATAGARRGRGGQARITWPWLLTLLLILAAALGAEQPGAAARTMDTPRGYNAFQQLASPQDGRARGDRRGRTRTGVGAVGGAADERLAGGAGRAYRTSPAAPFTDSTYVEVDASVQKMGAAAFNHSTVKAYSTAWKHWCDFVSNYYGDVNSYLTGADDPKPGEVRALRLLGYQESGICFHHRQHGLSDPFADIYTTSAGSRS